MNVPTETDPVADQYAKMRETPARPAICPPEDRQFILAEQAAGIDLDTIAEHLAHRRLVAEIRQVLSDAERRKAVQQQRRVETIYRFLPPPPPVTEQEIAQGHRNAVAPVKVKESEFLEFCASNGLDPAKMLDVWEGNLYEHEKWRQHRSGPQQYAVVQHQKRDWQLSYEENQRIAKEEAAYQKRLRAAVSNQSPYSSEAEDWTATPEPKSNVRVVRMG
jgi:hypothetical protein